MYIYFPFSVRTKDELNKLMTKASDYAGDKMNPCQYFYRNKSRKYFQQIEDEHRSNMKVRTKDNNGDPRSPINGALEGLFFCVKVQGEQNEPVPTSPFGPKRLLVPVEFLLNEAFKLYFTDFYCFGEDRPHYVTLVMTRPESKADDFCRLWLVEVPDKNRFLCWDKSTQKARVSEKIWVEVFYTEDIKISNIPEVNGMGKFTEVADTSGEYTKGVIPKYQGCPHCNL